MKSTNQICVVVFFVALCLVAASASAMEIGGVDLPDELTIGEKVLKLNGAGLRKKMWIKVYAGGLYLPEKNGDATQVIQADETMAIRMHFIYDGVSAEKLISAWNEGFEKATGGKTEAIADSINVFNGYYTAEAKEGHVHELVYEPGKGVTVTINGEVKGVIPGLEFKKALFGIWLCGEPADEGLKKGMLGG